MRRLAALLLLLAPSAAQAAPSVWVTHATVKIQPGTAPGSATAVSLSAARNEFEAFQIAINGGSGGATNVRVQPFTLSGPGGATIGSSNIWMYREGLITTQYASNQEVSPGTWPDALIPDVDETAHEQRNAFPFDVPPGENRVVWVDVLVPQNAAAGTYAGTVSLSGDNGFAATVDVSLQVWPFALPSTSSLPSTFGIGWDAACVGYYGGYNACGGDQGVITTQLQMVQFFLDHRVSIDSVYTGPSSNTSGYDWASWDAIYGPYFNGTAGTRLSGAKLTSIRYSWTGDSAHYGAWAQHFKAQGWFDRTFDYTCDEPPNGCAYSDIPGRVSTVRAGDPDFRTLVTTNIDAATSNGVLSDITQMTPIINEMDDKAGSSFAGSQRSKYDAYVNGGGKLFWYQSCESIGCGTPKSYDAYSTGWPSMMIDTPAMRNRAMEWLSYVYRMQGELYYETTFAFDSGGDAWNTQWYFGGNGDGTLVYPGTPSRIGGSTPVPVASMRLKLIREGMEDYEYLKMVSDLGDPGFALQQALTVVTNPYTIDDDPTAVYAARTALAQRIVQLMNPSASCSDGTAANACSATQPQQCLGGQLVNACATCGCPSGLTCQGDGSCSNQSQPGQYTAQHVASTPTLDGQFVEYEGMPQLAVGSATVQAAWDATNLYLAFSVPDGDLVASDGTEQNVWDSDSVEVMIDPTGNGGSSADADDVHVLVDVAGHVSDALGWTSYSYSSGAQVAVDLEGGTVGGAASGGGYRVELEIPWSSLGITPQDGLSFGFDVAVNDKTLGGSLTSHDWLGLSGFNNPGGWGHLTLSAVTPTTGSSSGSTGTTSSTSGTTTGGTTSGSTTTGGTTGGGSTTTSGATSSGGTTGTGEKHVVSSGCSSGGAGAELLAIVGALAALRRRRG